MFRGRENAHRELGQEMIDNVINLCGEKVQVEQAPKLLGRTLSCMLAPKSVKGGKKAAAPAPEQPAAPRQAPGLSPTR
jgi:translation initiation factor IF-3